MEFTIVVTARKGSQRLPGKNEAPLGDKSLVEWAVSRAAAEGYPVVLTTDIPGLDHLRGLCRIVERPEHLRGPEASHAETITHALEQAGRLDTHCVLLQPTSPFRGAGIVRRCVAAANENPVSTILSTHSVHVFDAVGGCNYGKMQLWDGNVAIYPPGQICEYQNIVQVRNSWINSLQIDDEQDYVDACSILHHTKALMDPVAPTDTQVCARALINHGVTGEVTLVARPDGNPIPQERPVAWLNHCEGWDGGRADVLFIIANAHLKSVGINRELRQVAEKAKLVIVPNNGEADWLYAALPVICGKHVEIRSITDPIVNHLTTGVMASALLARAGAQVTRVGFSGSADRALTPRNGFHYPAVSLEIAWLAEAGKDRHP